MGKMLFASDLDNTLLFSRRHSRPGDLCVEMLEGKEQGYFSPLTVARLREVNACMDFVPVTSRSVAQYRRICFPAGCVPRWAVTTNGGLLLENGEIDEAWQAESLEAVAPWREELERTEALLRAQPVPHRGRRVDELYVFAACDDAAGAHALAAALAGRTALEVAVSGRKVYCFPAPISKGHALERLRRRQGTPPWTYPCCWKRTPLRRRRRRCWQALPDKSACPGRGNTSASSSSGAPWPLPGRKPDKKSTRSMLRVLFFIQR